MFKRWLTRTPSSPPSRAWQQACRRTPILAALTPVETERLGERAWHFLTSKRLALHSELANVPFDEVDRLALAGQACLLTLGWREAEHREAFANVHEIVILPDSFTRELEEMDEFGVVHEITDERAGETSYQGPVVIAYTDFMESGDFTGFNVLIHELAHKIDMGNSMDIDGFPPLPRTLSAKRWYAVFSEVWEDLQRCLEQGIAPPIDDYAASHPGECFAVCCEYFFTAPDQLNEAYPALYALLVDYFDQAPLARLDPA
ncbi:zinc-dependent peptidase [Halomonas sp. 707D7]|uniref:M90 family metallopeptidase n=2 Tax=unclassified Halomonas TaxID=2609666 RepID=UPI0020A1A1A3|nr:M90 family metallopeptidase [Halomonas sp. 707D7]MCP1313206.1 zinc-dependent peptidase [Halomonas sp. 707D7]